MPTDLCFMPASDPATANDRLHLDLGRSARRPRSEIDRLHALRARRVDIGQPDAESSTTLADHERKRVLRTQPEGSSHPLRLIAENRGLTLSAA
jgi:hypothetical protein